MAMMTRKQRKAIQRKAADEGERKKHHYTRNSPGRRTCAGGGEELPTPELRRALPRRQHSNPELPLRSVECIRQKREATRQLKRATTQQESQDANEVSEKSQYKEHCLRPPNRYYCRKQHIMRLHGQHLRHDAILPGAYPTEIHPLDIGEHIAAGLRTDIPLEEQLQRISLADRMSARSLMLWMQMQQQQQQQQQQPSVVEKECQQEQQRSKTDGCRPKLCRQSRQRGLSSPSSICGMQSSTAHHHHHHREHDGRLCVPRRHNSDSSIMCIDASVHRISPRVHEKRCRNMKGAVQKLGRVTKEVKREVAFLFS